MSKPIALCLILAALGVISGCDLVDSLLPKTLAPEMVPAGGTYSSDQSITLTSDTPDAVIRFTTDGSTPGSESEVYGGAITVAGDGQTVTIKAIAKAEGMQDSVLSEQTYTIDYDSVSAPTISPASGVYTADFEITLQVAEGSPEGTQIRYELGGYEPTEASTLYTGPIVLGGHGAALTIKAAAFAAGYTSSGIVTGEYSISYPALPALGIDVPGRIFDSAATVDTTITAAVDGATILYTLDGSDPFSSATRVSAMAPVTISDIPVDPPTLLRAAATAPGYTPSPEIVEAYSSIPMVLITAPPLFQRTEGFFRESNVYVSKFEITQAQYIEVLTAENGTAPANPSYHKFDANWKNCPVERVTWYDAVEFCNKLNHFLYLRGWGGSTTNAYTITDRVPATGYPITSATVTINFASGGIRLPTEMEWELANRYGHPNAATKYTSIWEYAWGPSADDAPLYAWFDPDFSTVVGTLSPTAGICDIEGNVAEWISDWYAALPAGTMVDPTVDYTGPASGTYKIYRGSTLWDGVPFPFMSRGGQFAPGVSFYLVGIRVVH